jgi:hypothetical protein
MPNPVDQAGFRELAATHRNVSGPASPPASRAVGDSVALARVAVRLRREKPRWAKPSLGSGPRRSAGGHAGEGGGRQCQCTPAGTWTWALTCQPARSSPTLTGWPGPAPTAWANAARASVNAAVDTAGRNRHHVRPALGCPKAEREPPWSRCCPAARGRWPRGLQTRRKLGWRPRRCWSVGRRATSACGEACGTASPTAGRFIYRRPARWGPLAQGGDAAPSKSTPSAPAPPTPAGEARDGPASPPSRRPLWGRSRCPHQAEAVQGQR